MTAQIQFCVITRAPEDSGNLAMGPMVYLSAQANGGAWDDPPVPLAKALGNPMLQIYIQTPVFAPGEILVVNGDGREIGGAGRKPSKWGVDAEYFDAVDKAVARSEEVSCCG